MMRAPPSPAAMGDAQQKAAGAAESDAAAS